VKMRTFTQKQHQPQKLVSASLAHHREAELSKLEARAEQSDAEVTAATLPRFGYDFSRIPIHPPAAGAIQTKLAISKPGDTYEQEADRIADRVTATPAHPSVSGAPTRIQRFSGQSNRQQMDAVPASVEQALAGPGRPLEPGLRQDMERRFGHDFSRVRVHCDSEAANGARAVRARAYTFGNDIAFAGGEYAPATTEGKRLLTHELVHVVQQTSGQEIEAGRISKAHRMVQRNPDVQEAGGGGKTVSVYEEKSAQVTHITESEFQQNYIDNNIVLATGLAIPETTWGNIDDDRVPQMRLTYRDGRTLDIDVKDVPLQSSKPGIGIRKGDERAIRPLLYERRANGLIYPVRGQEKWRYVSYVDADNIMSLRAGLHDSISELQAGLTLIKITGVFASRIAALGGIAALNHSFGSGGLFEPVPRKGKPPTGGAPGSEATETQKGPVRPPGEEEENISPPQKQLPPGPVKPPQKQLPPGLTKPPQKQLPPGPREPAQKQLPPGRPPPKQLSAGKVPKIAMGDVKSIDGYNKGIRHISEMEGRGKYNTNGNIGIALYDRKTGEVYLQVLGPAAGPGQPRRIIYEGPIGRVQIPPGKTPVQIGNEVEEPVRDLVRNVTGQPFPAKPSNAPGPDLTTPK
jgi:hypothetical protein